MSCHVFTSRLVVFHSTHTSDSIIHSPNKGVFKEQRSIPVNSTLLDHDVVSYIESPLDCTERRKDTGVTAAVTAVLHLNLS